MVKTAYKGAKHPAFTQGTDTKVLRPRLHPTPAILHRYPPLQLTQDIQDHRHLDRLVPCQLAREGDSVVGLGDWGYADVTDVHVVPIFQIHLPIFSIPEQLLSLAAVLY